MDVYGSDSRQRMPNLPLLFRQDLGSWFALHKGMKLSKIHWEKTKRSLNPEETHEAATTADPNQRRIRELLRRIEQLSWRTYLRQKSRVAR
jgi:hypothetical protein